MRSLEGAIAGETCTAAPSARKAASRNAGKGFSRLPQVFGKWKFFVISTFSEKQVRSQQG